jgi:hypothetical protein
LISSARGYDARVKAKEMGQAGLHGWKGSVAERVADVADRKTPASGDVVRAFLGFALFTASLVYVLRTIAELARRSRG